MIDPTAIRPELPFDHDAIDAVHRDAFEGEAEVRLVRSLRDDKGFDPRLSVVSTDGDEIIAHALFTRVKIGPRRVVALAPMAVKTEHQRRGVGTALLKRSLEVCLATGNDVAVVLGHPDYYARFGFVPASEHNIRGPWDVPPEVFRVLAIESGALEGISGTVEYPAPFRDL